MPNLQRIEPLPHIEIQREPDQRQIRARPFPPSKVRPRDDRREHGERLREQTEAATQEIARLRSLYGIDPNRLVVLRFEVLDVDQRESLERLGVGVVEETEERLQGRTVYRVLAQFPDQQALDIFFNEYGSYGEESPTATVLPAAQRRDFFDALESVSFVTADERRGRRLQREGVPHEEPFYLDVDLWNPGSTQAEASVIQQFREFVERFGGRVVRDPLRIPSLILVKVQADARLLESLLNLDLVSLVDLPPRSLPEESFDIFEDVQVPDPLPQIPPNGPLACVVDSGIVAGHPLLRSVVLDEEDFRSGEENSVDRNGHGTQVAGLVVYGDVARRMVNNEWFPQVRVCIAKVLKHQDDPINRTGGWAVFPEEERAEEQLREAIEYFHRERGVRIFNLSIGHPDRVYEGGHQLPWAELLDDLARRLDLVIVVSAGNVPDPVLPIAVNSVDLQRQVIENVNSPKHRLIDPATAALCLTVGSVARRADPYDNQYMTRLAGSPEGAPSPFTRTGPGVAKAVKPELVHYGGNFAIGPLGHNPTWQRTDPNLGEPSLSHNFTGGRLLKATPGTSFAAAHVTYTAARIETALREQLGSSPSESHQGISSQLCIHQQGNTRVAGRQARSNSIPLTPFYFSQEYAEIANISMRWQFLELLYGYLCESI